MSDALTQFTARLSWPLLLTATVFGAGLGYVRYQSERQILEPLEALGPSPSEARPSPEPSLVEAPGPNSTPQASARPSAPPAKPASKAGAQAALESGDFAEAIRQGEVMRADELVEEAYLLQALTRSITPGPFARASEVVEVTLAKGGVLVGIFEGEGTRTLELVDGHERRLSPSEIAGERTLGIQERGRALEAALEAARQKLGEGAGALALHRLAYLSFSAGVRPLGTKYLRQALEGRDGAILVDMFGEGDFDRLHRARSVLAGEPVQEPIEQPIARVDPPPPEPVEPSPGQQPPIAPTPEPPAPLSSDQRPGKRHVRPKGPDDVIQSRAWKRADESYKAGLEVYRKTFGLSNRAAAIGVKAALGEFQRAQELLGPLSESHPDHYELEHRQEELAKLIIDCHRRQNIGD